LISPVDSTILDPVYLVNLFSFFGPVYLVKFHFHVDISGNVNNTKARLSESLTIDHLVEPLTSPASDKNLITLPSPPCLIRM